MLEVQLEQGPVRNQLPFPSLKFSVGDNRNLSTQCDGGNFQVPTYVVSPSSNYLLQSN